MRVPRALHPVPVRVIADADGRPTHVDGAAAIAIREEWRIEDGWWDMPIRRRYFAVVLENGSHRVVFEDRRRPGVWMGQRG